MVRKSQRTRPWPQPCIDGFLNNYLRHGNMKVLIATPYFWPQVGGLENYARFLARGLAEADCEVVVVCGDQGVRRPTRAEQDGYAVWRLPVSRVVSNTPV